MPAISEMASTSAVDANLRPTRWTDLELALGLVRSLCPEARLVKLNVEEARLLTGLDDPVPSRTGVASDLSTPQDGARPFGLGFWRAIQVRVP